MDWPLSREEKKRHLMMLYDREEEMTDSMLMSGHAALAKLKMELETIKKQSQSFGDKQKGISEDSQRLWQAVEAATAVFRAVVPSALEEDCGAAELFATTRRAKS